MKKIQTNYLNEIKQKYLENDLNSIARHALNNNMITDIIKSNKNSEFVQNNFSINLDTLPVTNQMQSGRCWIFAGCNFLREYTARKYNLESFELSQNYVAFYDKLEKANYFLESMVKLKDKDITDRVVMHLLNEPVSDGGQWDMFVNIIKKYGIVPKTVFPENYQSSNTAQINIILNRYLRKTALMIRKVKTTKEIETIKKKAIKDIYYTLCTSFGYPPCKFSFDFTDKKKKYHYKDNLTPKSFLNEFIGIKLDDYVSIINAPTKDKPFNKVYTVKYLGNVVEGNIVKYLNLDITRLKELTIKQLKNKELVWFGSDCVKYGYFDKKGGLWDDKSYNEDLLFQIDTFMTKEEMLDYRESTMNHAMVLTGVNLVKEKPTKWKIQNSWGDKVANKGYYVATDSWFDRFVYQVVINKKYLNDSELKALDKEVIYLEPWDPMGSLATLK